MVILRNKFKISTSILIVSTLFILTMGNIIDILQYIKENNISEEIETIEKNNLVDLQDTEENGNSEEIKNIIQNNLKVLQNIKEDNASEEFKTEIQNNLKVETTIEINLNASKQKSFIDALIPLNMADTPKQETNDEGMFFCDNKSVYPEVESGTPIQIGDPLTSVTQLGMNKPTNSNDTPPLIKYQFGVNMSPLYSEKWSPWASDGEVAIVTSRGMAAPGSFLLRVHAPGRHVKYQFGVNVGFYGEIWSPWASDGKVANLTTPGYSGNMSWLLKIKVPGSHVKYQFGVNMSLVGKMWSPWASNGGVARIITPGISGNMTFNMRAILTPTLNISFTASEAQEGSKVILIVNTNYSKNTSLTYSFDFQNDGIFDYIGKNNTTSFVWGDDYKGTAVVKVSDGNLSIKANTTVIVTNAQPKIKPFGPIIVDEGHSFNVTTNASDPGSDDLNFTWKLEIGPTISNIYYNNKLNPDLFPSPDGIYPFLVNDSINYTLSDDGIYNITLTVTDDDGLNSVYKTKVIVKNVAPTVNLKVISNKTNYDAKLTIRIAGEKWHDVKVELYKNGTEITNGSLTRYPGSPNEQMLNFLNFTLNPSELFTTIIRYTPNDDPVNGKPNGATPCWVILKLSNGKLIKLHHTFKVKHKDTHTWRVNLTEMLSSSGNSTNVCLSITAFDPGADNFTFYLDYGDGTNITKFYPNKNQTYPVMINITLIHNYISHGKLTITLIAKDDDDGITIIKFSINVG